MFRQILPLPAPASAPQAGSTISHSIPVGPTIDLIGYRLFKGGALVTLANLATDVSEIRLTADTGVFRRITPALLLALLTDNNQLGALTSDGTTAINSFVIPFSDSSKRTVEGEEAVGLGTVGIKQLLIEIDLIASASVYTVEGFVDQRPVPKKFGFIETWNLESITLVNGEMQFKTLSTADDYFGLIIGSSTVTKVRVERSLNSVQSVDFNAKKEDIVGAARYNGLTSNPANYFPVRFDHDRQLTSVLPMAIRDEKTGADIARVSDFTLTITATAGATVRALRRNLWLNR